MKEKEKGMRKNEFKVIALVLDISDMKVRH